jgi:hypothetical protein
MLVVLLILLMMMTIIKPTEREYEGGGGRVGGGAIMQHWKEMADSNITFVLWDLKLFQTKVRDCE